MSYTKYVMTGDGTFALISKMTGVEHSTLAHYASSPAKITTAGFLYANDAGELQSYGKSISMGLDSREEDGPAILAAIERGEVVIAENEMAGFFYATNKPGETGKVATMATLREHRIIERD